MTNPKWVDVSSWSRDDKDRTPKTWELETDELTICVTRTYGLDGWWLVCHDLRIGRRSLPDNLESAQTAALDHVRGRLRAMLESLP